MEVVSQAVTKAHRRACSDATSVVSCLQELLFGGVLPEDLKRSVLYDVFSKSLPMLDILLFKGKVKS